MAVPAARVPWPALVLPVYAVALSLASKPTRGIGLLLAAVALGGGLPAPAAAVRASAPPRQPIVEGVRWPDVSLPVMVDLSELPEEWQAPARRALTTWNGAGARFWYLEADPASAGANTVRLEVLDQIMTCGGQFQPAACTYPFVYQLAPQQISNAVVQLNRERLRNDRPRRPLDIVYVPALLTHELGHALGLGEASQPTAAMFPSALWTDLGEDDVREIRAMYGAADGPRTEQPPAPRQPADGSAAPLQLALAWEPVPAAFGYYVQVETAAVYESRGGFVDVGFGEYVVDTTTERPDYAIPRPLAESTEYYWRVKARTAGGNSPWSAPARFVATAAASELSPLN